MQLVFPAVAYKDSFMEAVGEFVASDTSERGERYKEYVDEIAEKGFERFVEEEKSHARGENLREGYVPVTTLWLIDGGEFVGRVSIRHRLNDYLQRVGGHIGYDIRPSKRKQGYGTTLLRLALPEARRIGLERLLVTCDATNEGSRKVIENNGGVLENSEIDELSGVERLRFWIDV
ncbi:MAG: GNAT family N-acetyltransferase [Candidatus Pacebacteria bacterium]|nr:GNAT family N-acetyltransferase [Candidatus Paceibacterota bacterium]